MGAPSTQSITRAISLKTLGEQFPLAAEVLAVEYGLHCVSCAARGIDTLEQGAKLHGLADTDIDELIRDLNERLAEDAPRAA